MATKASATERRPRPFAAPITFGFGVLLTALAIYFEFTKPSQEIGTPARLVVYTNGSFAAPWGPGPSLVQRFKSQCHCHVDLISVQEGGLLLQRLQLVGRSEQVDLVIGLDLPMLPQALKTHRWQNLKRAVGPVNWSEDLPEALSFDEFLPIDWSPMTFIYRSDEVDHQWPLPATLQQMLSAKLRSSFALMDPRTSIPGLQFLLWLLANQGEPQTFSFLGRLRDNVASVSGSWSQAYGLFKKGQARFAWSYLSSVLYHWNEEQDQRYQPLLFTEPAMWQAEYVGIPQSCRRCQLATQFVQFLLGEPAQKILLEKNFMFPVSETAEQTQLRRQLFKDKWPQQLISSSQILRLASQSKELMRRWGQLSL